MVNGTVRHWCVLPESQNDFAVSLAPRYRLTSEICASRATDARMQRDPSVNADWGCPVTGWRSDNNTAPPVAIDLARAAEGARIAARLVRQHRMRDLLSAIEEWRRADGPDRTYWRQQARWLISQWRCLYEQPERAAFNAAVAKSRRAA